MIVEEQLAKARREGIEHGELKVEVVQRHLDKSREEVERLAHGVCDALKWLVDYGDDDMAAVILRSLLKGTAHEGHRG